MNIHEKIKEQSNLAAFYAEDGAFHTSARIFKDLSEFIKDHAIACDKSLEQAIKEQNDENLS